MEPWLDQVIKGLCQPLLAHDSSKRKRKTEIEIEIELENFIMYSTAHGNGRLFGKRCMCVCVRVYASLPVWRFTYRLVSCASHICLIAIATHVYKNVQVNVRHVCLIIPQSSIISNKK